MRKQPVPTGRYLEYSTRVRVRFQEVDSLQIVWHGHYLSYFEDARTAFGRAYGVGYEDMLDQGVVAPVVQISCDYFAPAKYTEELIVTARLFERDTAKIEFYYQVLKPDKSLCATGKTVQVFLDVNGNLILTMPEFMRTFYEKWNHKYGIVP